MVQGKAERYSPSFHPPMPLHPLPLSRTALPRLLTRLAPGALLVSAWASQVSAQVPPPPLPPSEEESAALDSVPAPVDSSSESDEPALDEPSPTESDATDSESSAATASASSTAGASPSVEATTQAGTNATAPYPVQPEEEEDEEEASWFRLDSTRRQPTLSGSTGLMRVKEAGSGEAGTFRMQLLLGYFSGRGFLCNSGFPCFDPVTGQASLRDKSQRSSGLFNLSVTPFSFLEAFITLNNSATYNSEGTPQSLQVVGDTNFGIKGFLPQAPDRIIKAGAEADMYLLTGTGGVGLLGAATSFAMRGLMTLDLNNRTEKSDRIPLRAHVNLGYYFDNSSKLVENLEETPPPEGRGGRVTRIERYGLGISRVDSFQIGLGTEYIHPYVRPFIEWNLDIPVNRQGYECVITDRTNDRTENADQCLKLAAGLATSPSRLTLGARVFPWQRTGLALSLAADIGTGATRRFLDETRPESPYTIWFGLGYTVDVAEKDAAEAAQVEPVVMPTPEIRRYVMGRVMDEKTAASVPDAIIRYKDVPMTGLISNVDGLFISQDLPAGEYVFEIQAKDYKNGTCVVDIPETAPQQAPAPEADGSLDPAQTEPADTEDGAAVTEDGAAVATADADMSPYMDQDGNILVPLDCKLGELPPVANVTGLLVDGRNGGPVTDATVMIVDELNRSLSLDVDAAGAFQFRNVPFGEARLRAAAPGYLPTIHPIKITSRVELKAHVLMNPRPQKLGVTITKTEIKLARPIEFVGDTVELNLDSTAMIEELAVALSEKTDLGVIEIQVHTDDTGAESYSRRLSQERADYLKNLLVDLGVLPRMLKAKGYGPDQPLTPNVSDESRAKNNRVQFIVETE